MKEQSYTGRHVVILGMARQGLALARFLISRHARVTLSDVQPQAQLAEAAGALRAYAAAIEGSPAPTFALGGHPLSLLDDCDLLCLSGGVSPALPIVRAAVDRGIPLSNDGAITLEECPAPVLGITGSAGKTTTTTLTGLMLEASQYTVHVGGNIGTPLIDRLDAVGPGDKIVMELSSFQLELFRRSPVIAGLLNITPNHLDRHPSMSHYAAAKSKILEFQEPGNVCVLNADDAYTGPWLATGRCSISAGDGQDAVYFPIRAERLGFSLAGDVVHGACLSGDRLVWRPAGQREVEICRSQDVRLRGRHNLANILAACCLAGAAGAEASAMTRVATGFGGVEHRLEVVRHHNGILWINDSIATTPERAVAALRSFSEPIVLLSGGRDKHLPWEDLAAAVHEDAPDGERKVRRVVLFGEAAGLIKDALLRHAEAARVRPVAITTCSDLEEAVRAAAPVALAGDVVLLAPGGTSFDAYRDFAARGDHFRRLVEALP